MHPTTATAGALIAFLISTASAARAAFDVSNTCSLAVLPQGAVMWGKAPSTLRIFPDPKLLPDDYSGCIGFWQQDGIRAYEIKYNKGAKVYYRLGEVQSYMVHCDYKDNIVTRQDVSNAFRRKLGWPPADSSAASAVPKMDFCPPPHLFELAQLKAPPQDADPATSAPTEAQAGGQGQPPGRAARPPSRLTGADIIKRANDWSTVTGRNFPRINSAYLTEDFDAMERVYSEIAASPPMNNGALPIATFQDIFVSNFSKDTDWDDELGRLKSWQQRFPKSVLAPIAEAYYWHGYAWTVRGHGYSNTVAPEAWDLFAERLRKGEEVLLAAKATSSVSPIWYDAMLRIGLGSRWSREKYKAVFEEAVSKAPGHRSLFYLMLNSLTPRWGGNWEMVDKFIRESAERTKATEGLAYYALLYRQVAYDTEIDFFGDTKVSWPMIKRGLEDHAARHPDPINNYAYAGLACKARDKLAAQKALLEIGKNYVPRFWEGSIPYETCKQWAFERA